MKKNSVLVTKEGLEKLKQELEIRSTTKREQLKNVMDEMRARGDLSENDGYTLAVEDFQNNEAEIVRIKEIVDNAKIAKKGLKDSVEIGEKVKLKNEEGQIVEYTIVGEGEADPMQNMVSYSSPIGKAVVGKKVGEKVVVETPKGKNTYTIVFND